MLALLLRGALAVPAGDPIKSGCRSISASAAAFGDGDAWCVKNCAAGNCPPTICECDGEASPRGDQEKEVIAQRDADIAQRDADINARPPAVAETNPAGMGAPATPDVPALGGGPSDSIIAQRDADINARDPLVAETTPAGMGAAADPTAAVSPAPLVQAPRPEPVQPTGDVQAPAPEPVQPTGAVQAPRPEPVQPTDTWKAAAEGSDMDAVVAQRDADIVARDPMVAETVPAGMDRPASAVAETIPAGMDKPAVAVPTAVDPSAITVANATKDPRLRKSETGIAPAISGPWFYCADGLGYEKNGRERTAAFGTNTSRKLPKWLAATHFSGNSISLAFMNPLELGHLPDHGVPAAFVEYTAMLRKYDKNRQIFFSIGGLAFKGNFKFLSNKGRAETAGRQACAVAKKHNVGIEIDHEGAKGHDVDRLRDFLHGFRQGCPMGKYLISMDVMGGPGGGGIGWGPAAVSKLLPAKGSPSDKPIKGGPWLDFVNVMVRSPTALPPVCADCLLSSLSSLSSLTPISPLFSRQVIDACSSGSCLTDFWKQWNSERFYTNMNFKRATFSFAAGGAFGICNKYDSDVVREAWAWAQEEEAYGLRAWMVGVGPGGDWNPECDESAPGLQAMCAAVGICEPAPAPSPGPDELGLAPVGAPNDLRDMDAIIAQRDADTAQRDADIAARNPALAATTPASMSAPGVLQPGR